MLASAPTIFFERVKSVFLNLIGIKPNGSRAKNFETRILAKKYLPELPTSSNAFMIQIPKGHIANVIDPHTSFIDQILLTSFGIIAPGMTGLGAGFVAQPGFVIGSFNG